MSGAFFQPFRPNVLLVSGREIAENSADVHGRGIVLAEATDVSMSSNLWRNNSAAGGDGGAIWVGQSSTAKITGDTAANNQAGDDGGAIFVASGTLNLINSTLSQNEGDTGGALYLASTTAVTVAHSTMVSNTYQSPTQTVGGIYIEDEAQLTMLQTILSGNSGNNCVGALSDNGYNLSSDSSCVLIGTGSLTNSDPLLISLTDNGGHTAGDNTYKETIQTHALQSGSPALDQISENSNGCGTTYTTDQRGISRPQWTACDIGAFELESDVVTPPTLAIAYTSPTIATLSWNENSANISYELFRSETPYADHTSQGSVSNSPFIQDIGDSSGINYFYYVQASDRGGGTAASNKAAIFYFTLTPGN